ncbi:Mrp/NBP35 family ATP-binding protein, partial [Pseudoalteromonas shioyasakiensis]|uniref:Mrp/NBP35 family ATP-binding protein n=1 Tax=Pseudoalteromonas shioyasakiensis TaxID=1190813 RepID=UPI001EFC8F8D|nr:Mrp/NBP35 family ATP-binding protein [Pseudoalteromonas shioyasakiensis]
MTIANQIRSKLLELEGGIFQRLCDDWLHRKGYENINSIGMMDTTDRVTKGTPDCLFIQPDGYYLFSEYTVQQNRLAEKLEDDINKCFDEQKTGIKSEHISEIIICYLGNLTTKEINHLKSLCQKRHVRLGLNGLDSISLSIQNCYPVLSEQYLGLALDTGQLLSVNDFVTRYGKNNLTTPIDNKILFQSDAIDKGLEQLRRWKLLLVSGAAGVGKTLFSVNLATAMQKNNPDLKVYCLFDKGADLIRDITAYFSEPGDYLIFVDDANRLDRRLDYILHYLNENDENRTFRIVATVRDYARDSVLSQASKFTEVQEQTIQPLTDEQIKELVVELFDIKNGEYQQRVQEISGGNARLAMMAAKIAVETNQIESIQNVASLYDDYFSQNENIREVVEDEKLMTTACAISFFRKIDKLNNSHMEWLQNSFGISSEEFWGYVEVLHKKELVDLYEDEVVKISDQVLSTYLFYLSVFEKKVISFSMIVHHFYPDFKRTIVDALNPIISAFDHKKIVTEIRTEIKGIFKGIENSGDLNSSIEFLNSFWFALPTETLIFANTLISKMPIVVESWQDEAFEEAKIDDNEYSLVSLLSRFRNYSDDEFKMSFDLLLQYLLKSKGSLGFVIKTLTDSYNFKPDDMRYGYYVQAHVVDRLVERSEHGANYLFSRIFILLAKSFLKVEHTENKWGRGDTITVITYRLTPDEYLTQIREKIFKNLATLMCLPDYEQLIQDIFQLLISRLRFEGKEMAEADLPFIAEFFISNLDPKNTSHCLIMQDLFEHLDALEIKYPSKWQAEFNNSTVELSNLLRQDRHEMRLLDMSYEEYDQYRHQCFVDYFTVTTIEGFRKFMSQCVSLQNSLFGRELDYSLKVGIEKSLEVIAENHQDKIKEIASIYIDYDDTFNIQPGSLICNLFKALSCSEVWELINSKSYRWKKYWRSFYFSMLPENEINGDETYSLLIHLNDTPSNELPTWLDYLSKYQSID